MLQLTSFLVQQILHPTCHYCLCRSLHVCMTLADMAQLDHNA